MAKRLQSKEGFYTSNFNYYFKGTFTSAEKAKEALVAIGCSLIGDYVSDPIIDDNGKFVLSGGKFYMGEILKPDQAEGTGQHYAARFEVYGKEA